MANDDSKMLAKDQLGSKGLLELPFIPEKYYRFITLPSGAEMLVPLDITANELHKMPFPVYTQRGVCCDLVWSPEWRLSIPIPLPMTNLISKKS